MAKRKRGADAGDAGRNELEEPVDNDLDDGRIDERNPDTEAHARVVKLLENRMRDTQLQALAIRYDMSAADMSCWKKTLAQRVVDLMRVRLRAEQEPCDAAALTAAVNALPAKAVHPQVTERLFSREGIALTTLFLNAFDGLIAVGVAVLPAPEDPPGTTSESLKTYIRTNPTSPVGLAIGTIGLADDGLVFDVLYRRAAHRRHRLGQDSRAC